MFFLDEYLSANCFSNNNIMYRTFLFTPEVPIRLDYQGKHVDMTHGPLAGLLMGLGQLSCSELKLKRLSHRHGFVVFSFQSKHYAHPYLYSNMNIILIPFRLLGFDKLMTYALLEWLQDIKKNQLPSLLGGVGPMHSLVQLCKSWLLVLMKSFMNSFRHCTHLINLYFSVQGIRDLFWLPIEQYQKDGRIVRGLQRGANSFTTSTAMAALELTSRLVQAIQV